MSDAASPRRDPYKPFSGFEAWAESEATSLVDTYAAQLKDLRSEVGDEVASASLRTATRWAAVDTGALEGLYEVDRGFTYSVALNAASWELIAEVKGDSTARSIEDALNAYDFVLDAVTQKHPVTEVWIRELHALVTASQETYTVLTAVGPQDQDLPRGVYKTQPNNPLNLKSAVVHEYASPADTPAEMARLIEELRSETFLAGHPVLQAAFAHYAFVCIHPFADGNGRVARALASLFLYRGYSLPAVIFADQKADYLDALEAADSGDLGKFAEFMSDRVVDSISMISAEIRAALEEDVDKQMSALQSSLEGIAGIPHVEMDAIAQRVMQQLARDFVAVIEQKPLREPLSAGANVRQDQRTAVPTGYRRPPGGPGAVLTVRSNAPASAEDSRFFNIFVRRPEHHGPDLLITRGQEVMLEVFAREVRTSLSQALLYRIKSVATREYRQLTAAVSKAAEETLRRNGYI